MLDERLVLAIGPRSPWQARLGLRSVAGEPFIIIARARSASFYDHALSVCAAAGFAPRIVQEANELFTVLSLVGAGLGRVAGAALGGADAACRACASAS